jgi:hypothetical protein
MLTHSKATWKELKAAPAGHRFEMHYHRERGRRGKGSPLRTGLTWAGAIVAFGVGVVLVFIPGPAVVFFALAAALLATQSLRVARALDWIELEGRAVARALRRWYHRRSSAQRVVLLIALGCAVAAAGVLAVALLLGRR